MDASSIHASTAWLVIIANAVAGIWALSAHWLPAARGRAMWVFIAIAQVAIFVQVGFGVAAISGRDSEPYQFHMFYGFLAIATVGIIYSYRPQVRQHQYVLYGLGSLFLMGLGLRAMIVSPTAGF